MDNLNDNVNDQLQEEQVEQSQQGTPQEQEQQPEFSLDENGNFQWNTDEYDNKYQEEDSDDD